MSKLESVEAAQARASGRRMIIMKNLNRWDAFFDVAGLVTLAVALPALLVSALAAVVSPFELPLAMRILIVGLSVLGFVILASTVPEIVRSLRRRKNSRPAG